MMAELYFKSAFSCKYIQILRNNQHFILIVLLKSDLSNIFGLLDYGTESGCLKIFRLMVQYDKTAIGYQWVVYVLNSHT